MELQHRNNTHGIRREEQAACERCLHQIQFTADSVAQVASHRKHGHGREEVAVALLETAAYFKLLYSDKNSSWLGRLPDSKIIGIHGRMRRLMQAE
jgi:hypothetical protein